MNTLVIFCSCFSLKNIYMNYNMNNNMNNNNIILPPINNIYKTKIYVPLIGSQNIEYCRFNNYKSKITLSGFLNKQGFITFNKNNPYDYTFDEILTNIINKYKCELYNPNYDYLNDIITIKIKIKVINFKKEITLKNINNSD